MKAPERATHAKVLFYVEQPDGTFEVESLWAVPEGEGYRLDNIPFFARGLALGDLVAATKQADGSLRFANLLLASGHSTVRLLFAAPAEVQPTRDQLSAMGCDSERWNADLIAVDVPREVPYGDVRAFLELGERGGIFEYEEGCLGQP